MESFIWNSFELVEDCFLFKVVFVRSSSNRCAICFVHVSRKKREKTYVYAICMMVKWIMEQEYGDQQFRKRHCLRVRPRVLDESTVKRSIIIYRDSNLNKILRARREKCWMKFEGWLKFFEIYLLFKIFKKNSNLFFALQVKKLWKIHWSCRIDKIDCYESV